MSVHNEFGTEGEEIAKNFLLDLGHDILDLNWRFEKSEIDIISIENETLVFSEVKTRHISIFGTPESFVDEAKIRNVTKAAEEYIQVVDYNGEIRFDIISILFENKIDYTIKHFRDAFWNYE